MYNNTQTVVHSTILHRLHTDTKVTWELGDGLLAVHVKLKSSEVDWQ